jgi:hypothetical protein
MSKFCPNNKEHKHFVTTAVICQSWLVDGEGNFIEVTDECTDIFHKPSPSNIWECADCGEEAVEK